MPKNDTRFFNYLPVGDDQLGWGLYVTGAGEGEIPPHGLYPPSGHPSLYSFDWREGRILPEYQVILITRGEGEFRSRESGTVNVAAGSVVLLFPDVWHSYRPNPRTGWYEIWMSLNGTTLYELQRQARLSPAKPVFPATNAQKLERELRLVVRAVRTQPAENSLALAAGAMRVLAEVIEHGPGVEEHPHAAPVHSELIREALRLIWNWSYRDVTVSTLSRTLKVTQRTLERRFHAELHTNVREQIEHCRLQRAQLLLRNTQLPIKYIAYAAGFSTPERMSKVFRRVLGTSPREWQRNQS